MRHLALAACVTAAILVGGIPSAKAQPVPTSPEARPRGEPASQTSIPAHAPPASLTQTTGATNQDATVKQMNSTEKAKVDKEGK